MKIKTVFQLVLCIVLPLAIGGFSGYLTANEINDDWFVNLIKPPFNPSNYLFGPVWTMLYILMGVSLFMIVRMQKSEFRTNAILAFGLQLFLNFWWSIFFFRFHRHAPGTDARSVRPHGGRWATRALPHLHDETGDRGALHPRRAARLPNL